ncbi:hypothetical protein ABZ942_15490 [Nocardia sp. NPDC046473]|uniref:hypothetical protein n=1 Tax=Nocardia sp. NPDC046473 TaxID=3155733 RepID=UPI0033DFB227
MSQDDNDIEIDWESQLWEPMRELLDSCDIDPDTAHRPDLRVLLKRRIRKAKAGMAATAVTAPLLGVTVFSGAPAAVICPVCVWGVGWIGYGAWISAGYPNPIAVGGVAVRGVRRGGVLVWRWINHRAFAVGRIQPITRPELADAPPF